MVVRNEEEFGRAIGRKEESREIDMSNYEGRQGKQRGQMEDLFRHPSPQKRVGIVHLQMVKERRCLYGTHRFVTPCEAVEVVRPLVDMADRELVIVMSLNTKLEPMAVEIVGVGGVGSCIVDTANIFKHAILSNATYVIFFHNHPSGSPEPSQEDRLLSERLAAAGKLMGIRLIDSIVIGEGAFYSFREHDEPGLESADWSWIKDAGSSPAAGRGGGEDGCRQPA